MSLLSKVLIWAAAISLFSGIAKADISVVALTGQSFPGTANATVTSLSKASVNNSGEIAFISGFSNAGSALFQLSNSRISLVSITGQSIPGSPGLTLGLIVGDPAINDSSAISFSANIQGGASRLQGVFVASGSSINKVIDTTTPIPGSGNQTIYLFGSPQINNNGDIAVHANLTGDPGYCILLISSGVLSSVIPDALDSFALNNRDDIAYLGLDGGIHLFSGGTSQLIAQRGQSVSNSNLTLDTLQYPALNDQTDIVFVNGSEAGLFNNFSSNAVIRYRGGILEQIASIGDPVPGREAVTLQGDFAFPLIDNSSRIFFVSRFYSPNATNAIFLFDNGNLSILAQEGQDLQGVGTLTFLGEPSINNSGILTFVSNLDNSEAGIFQLNDPAQPRLQVRRPPIRRPMERPAGF